MTTADAERILDYLRKKNDRIYWEDALFTDEALRNPQWQQILRTTMEGLYGKT